MELTPIVTLESKLYEGCVDMKKTWLVTGTSKGIGYELVKMLLENNQNVIATSREVDKIIKIFGPESEQFLPVNLLLTNDDSVRQVIEIAFKKFGVIDVLVNNAGYMMAGSIEDISAEDARHCFDVNVFGTINMIKHVLPIMREQKSGHIINTSSISGLRSGALEGIYSATKFAINGISHALAEEVSPFNIHVTNVIPGFIRTEFLEKTSYRISTASSAYKKITEQRLGFVGKINKNQPGNPTKVAQLYMQVVEMEHPPLDLLVGSDSLQLATMVAKGKIENAGKYNVLSSSIDF